MELKETVLMRGGATSPDWKTEDTEITFRTNGNDVRFDFDIASKGGGRTQLGLFIGRSDVREMLMQIAQEVPDVLTDLTVAVALAAERMQRTIGEVRRNLDAAEPHADQLYDHLVELIDDIDDPRIEAAADLTVEVSTARDQVAAMTTSLETN